MSKHCSVMVERSWVLPEGRGTGFAKKHRRSFLPTRKKPGSTTPTPKEARTHA